MAILGLIILGIKIKPTTIFSKNLKYRNEKLDFTNRVLKSMKMMIKFK